MNYISKLMSVFMTGSVELWLAIPLGIKLGLTPWETALASAMGAIVGVLVICLVGAAGRAMLVNRIFGHREAVMQSRSARLFHAYGAPGLGMIGILLVGAPLSGALGLVMGAQVDRIIKWLLLGILFWSAVAFSIAQFGFGTPPHG